MKAIHALLSAVAFALAGTAFAGGGLYPPETTDQTVEPAKTRAQVAAEAREAVRLGLLSFAEGDAPIATPEQERLIAAAGRRAAELVLIAAKKKADAQK